MGEDTTFSILKRTPFDEVLEILNNLRSPVVSRTTNVNNSIVLEHTNLYMNLARHHRYIEILNEHGWEYIDFMAEVERSTLTRFIEEFNAAIIFPKELIEQARKFYPDIKLTNAKIEF